MIDTGRSVSVRTDIKYIIRRFSVFLLSRMIFNLCEAGTEVHETTDVWKCRLENGIAAVQPQPLSLKPIHFREPSRLETGEGIDLNDISVSSDVDLDD